MSAFFIASVTIKQPEKFQEYSKAAHATFTEYGGQMLAKGIFEGNLVGETQSNAAGIVMFPDLDSIDRWYSSESYQALIPLRDEAADIVITKYAVPG